MLVCHFREERIDKTQTWSERCVVFAELFNNPSIGLRYYFDGFDDEKYSNNGYNN
jgi:hypothetical protein